MNPSISSQKKYKVTFFERGGPEKRGYKFQRSRESFQNRGSKFENSQILLENSAFPARKRSQFVSFQALNRVFGNFPGFVGVYNRVFRVRHVRKRLPYIFFVMRLMDSH